jgi:hypothetical protein
MVAAVEAKESPLRLPLGDVGIQAIRKKMAVQSAEIDRWLDMSLATSFETASRR